MLHTECKMVLYLKRWKNNLIVWLKVLQKSKYQSCSLERDGWSEHDFKYVDKMSARLVYYINHNVEDSCMWYVP
jgi:hypothetical protein